MQTFDAVIVGAGAAGLFCAGVAGQAGLKVLLVDHSDKVGEKIRISGGGRCNFTNRDLDPRAPHRHFLGENPQFCRSALSRYTPQDFIALVQRHGIAFHEKHKGQLFGDRSSEDFIRMLLAECEAGGVTRWQPCAVREVSALPPADPASARFRIETDREAVQARHVVIATGGLSIPKIGASDFGYRIARQFGLRIVETRPALVPLTFDGEAWAAYSQLAGLSLPVAIETGEKKSRAVFHEDLLFTHRGLSGPAVLQISSYWRAGQPIRIDLAPEHGPAGRAGAGQGHLAQAHRQRTGGVRARPPGRRLGAAGRGLAAPGQRGERQGAGRAGRPPARTGRWSPRAPRATGRPRSPPAASTPATCRRRPWNRGRPGLYFIGEVVDVTGWLGGYNFQWAWASARGLRPRPWQPGYFAGAACPGL